MGERRDGEGSVLALRRRREDAVALGWGGDLASVLVRPAQKSQQNEGGGGEGRGRGAGGHGTTPRSAEQQHAVDWGGYEATTPAHRPHKSAEELGFVSGDLGAALLGGGEHGQTQPGGRCVFTSRRAQRREEIIGRRLAELDAEVRASMPRRPRANAADWGGGLGDVLVRKDGRGVKAPSPNEEEGEVQSVARRTARPSVSEWGGGLGDVLPNASQRRDTLSVGRRQPDAHPGDAQNALNPAHRPSPARPSAEDLGFPSGGLQGAFRPVRPAPSQPTPAPDHSRRTANSAARAEHATNNATRFERVAGGHGGEGARRAGGGSLPLPTQGARTAPSRGNAAAAPVPRPASGTRTGAGGGGGGGGGGQDVERTGGGRRAGLNLESWPRVTAVSAEAPDTAWDAEFALSLGHRAGRGGGATGGATGGAAGAWWPSLGGFTGYMLGGGGMMGAFPLGGLGGGGAMTYESMLDLDKSVKKPGLSAAELRALGKVVVSEEQACGEDACTICLEAFRAGGRATQLVCKHLFHSDCIERWLADHAVCPLCRCQVGDGKG